MPPVENRISVGSVSRNVRDPVKRDPADLSAEQVIIRLGTLLLAEYHIPADMQIPAAVPDRPVIVCFFTHFSFTPTDFPRIPRSSAVMIPFNRDEKCRI